MVFAIIGATFTFNLFGLNFLVILLVGMLTAVGEVCCEIFL
ncbi:MAG: hypothetical protein ACRBB5_00690 [Nitrosopumilus sp.]